MIAVPGEDLVIGEPAGERLRRTWRPGDRDRWGPLVESVRIPDAKNVDPRDLLQTIDQAGGQRPFVRRDPPHRRLQRRALNRVRAAKVGEVSKAPSMPARHSWFWVPVSQRL